MYQTALEKNDSIDPANFFLCVLKINELVDARDLNMGAWFEAQIVTVTKTTKTPKEEAAEAQQEEILYHVKYEE